MYQLKKYFVLSFLLAIFAHSQIQAANAVAGVAAAAAGLGDVRRNLGFLGDIIDFRRPGGVGGAPDHAFQNLLDRQRNLAERFDANPQDAAIQQQLAAVDDQIRRIRDHEMAEQAAARRNGELFANVVAGVLNAPLAEQAAVNDRRRAVAQALAQGRAANQGAMERLQVLTSKENIIKISVAIAAVGGSLVASYFIAKFCLNYAERFIGMPKLIRDSSEKNLWQRFVGLFQSEEDAEDFFSNIILSDENQAIVAELSTSLKDNKDDGTLLRNILLYGEPGTGKTMLAKKLAHYCGMDYACFSASDLLQFEPSERIVQINKLFDRAEETDKGLIIFVDEAESCFGNRANLDDDGKAVVNAFLARTGSKSNKYMLMLATNHPQALDPAVISRLSKKIHIGLPDIQERIKILNLYLTKYFVTEQTILGGEEASLSPDLSTEQIAEIAQLLTGWSGRDLEDLVGEIRYVLSNQHTRVVTQNIIQKAVDEKIKQRASFAQYDGRKLSVIPEAAAAA